MLDEMLHQERKQRSRRVNTYFIHIPQVTTLFRKKRFMLDEMTQRNTSKFAIFMEYENPPSFFHFSFCATLFFSLMNALVYVDIDLGIQ